jgi:hypothetical protein
MDDQPLGSSAGSAAPPIPLKHRFTQPAEPVLEW